MENRIDSQRKAVFWEVEISGRGAVGQLVEVPGWCNSTDVMWVRIPAPQHKAVAENPSRSIWQPMLRIKCADRECSKKVVLSF